LDLLWTSFLNSEWHDWRGGGQSEDRLEKPGWIEKFLAHWQLPCPGEPADPGALKRLRTLIRRMAEEMAAGGTPTPEDLAALNTVMAGGPVIRQVSSEYHLSLQPAGATWAQIEAEIAASLATTLAEGEAARVRICENPDCLWVFYDDTRNRTKRFCEDKTCGNLIKVRRFRAKQKRGS
jgi:predicted RNA-binding Zn ribbon-like protein